MDFPFIWKSFRFPRLLTCANVENYRLLFLLTWVKVETSSFEQLEALNYVFESWKTCIYSFCKNVNLWWKTSQQRENSFFVIISTIFESQFPRINFHNLTKRNWDLRSMLTIRCRTPLESDQIQVELLFYVRKIQNMKFSEVLRHSSVPHRERAQTILQIHLSSAEKKRKLEKEKKLNEYLIKEKSAPAASTKWSLNIECMNCSQWIEKSLENSIALQYSTSSSSVASF